MPLCSPLFYSKMKYNNRWKPNITRVTHLLTQQTQLTSHNKHNSTTLTKLHLPRSNTIHHELTLHKRTRSHHLTTTILQQHFASSTTNQQLLSTHNTNTYHVGQREQTQTSLQRARTRRQLLRQRQQVTLTNHCLHHLTITTHSNTSRKRRDPLSTRCLSCCEPIDPTTRRKTHRSPDSTREHSQSLNTLSLTDTDRSQTPSGRDERRTRHEVSR